MCKPAKQFSSQNYFIKMQKLATKTLNQIQQLLTTPTPKVRKSTSTLLKQPRDKSKSKSPIAKQPSPAAKAPSQQKTYKNVRAYQPLQKQNKLINRQVKAIYDQMDYQRTHRVQNKHSFFLNAKHPKAPIYQRAQRIVQERQMMLEQKRREMQRLKQQQEYQEQQQYLAEAPSKKTMSKHEAQKLSDRLYRDHYSKLNRLNHQKMQRLKEETKIYREKPLISKASKEIFQVLKEKQHLQNDVFNRFENYDMQKAKKQAQINKFYKNKYLPFKPAINETSRLLTGDKSDRHQLSTSQHCQSCLYVKHSKSTLNLTVSPHKSSVSKIHPSQSSVNVAHFQ